MFMSSSLVEELRVPQQKNWINKQSKTMHTNTLRQLSAAPSWNLKKYSSEEYLCCCASVHMYMNTAFEHDKLSWIQKNPYKVLWM